MILGMIEIVQERIWVMYVKYRIIEVKEDYLEEALDVVKKTIDEFEAPEYSKEGIEYFYKFIDIDNIKKMLNNNLRLLMVESYDRVVGVIGYRDNSHICLLFVDKKHHHQGIAKALYEKVRKEVQAYTDKITVNSSPYALGFYKKMGFIETNEPQEVDGIKFIPMEISIK